MSVHIFKEEEKEDPIVKLKLVEEEEDAVWLVSTHPDGRLQYYLMRVDNYGVALVEGIPKQFGIETVNGKLKVLNGDA